MLSVDDNTRKNLLNLLAAENARRAAAGEPLLPVGPTTAELNVNGESAAVTLM